MLCDNDNIYVPVPVFNLISGGRSAGNSLVYKEFLILPTGMPKTRFISPRLEIFHLNLRAKYTRNYICLFCQALKTSPKQCEWVRKFIAFSR